MQGGQQARQDASGLEACENREVAISFVLTYPGRGLSCLQTPVRQRRSFSRARRTASARLLPSTRVGRPWCQHQPQAAAARVTYRPRAKPCTSTASNTRISLQGQGHNPHLSEESTAAEQSRSGTTGTWSYSSRETEGAPSLMGTRQDNGQLKHRVASTQRQACQWCRSARRPRRLSGQWSRKGIPHRRNSSCGGREEARSCQALGGIWFAFGGGWGRL